MTPLNTETNRRAPREGHFFCPLPDPAAGGLLR
jgi:hypothetical protein